MPALTPTRLARLRLAAQRLTPETAARTPAEACRAVLGIQAQDTRAAGLALRSRVPGVERADIDADRELVRTWTVRGTVHLLARDDLPLLHTLTGARFSRRYEALIDKRGNLDIARKLLPPALEEFGAGEPLTRAQVLTRLAGRGLPDLGPYSVNVFIPWIASQGLIEGLADGRFRASDPPKPIDEDEALATLARRYLEGYGPAGAPDLVRWSGLPLGMARRAFEAAGDLEPAGADLLAVPGTLDAEPPPVPPALLLPAFDTAMLGWRSREPLVAAEHDARILPGGGMLKAVVLTRGRATGNWRIAGSGAKRRLELDWFGRPAAARALDAERADIARFLGVELSLPAGLAAKPT